MELVWPQVMPITLRPPKLADTFLGVDWLVVVPEPIWPQLFWPHEKMSPSAVRQREWWLPQATCSTNECTRRGGGGHLDNLPSKK